MTKMDERTKANLDVALEHVCRSLSHCGGDHKSRKHVAKKLMQAAKKGNTGLMALEDVARRALRDLAGKELASRDRLSFSPVHPLYRILGRHGHHCRELHKSR